MRELSFEIVRHMNCRTGKGEGQVKNDMSLLYSIHILAMMKTWELLFIQPRWIDYRYAQPIIIIFIVAQVFGGNDLIP